MEATILVNRAHGETRLALLEDGAVAEIYVERDHELGLVGNIYKGRVTRVLPGMQAAFVDIGLDKAAFLYVDDIWSEEPDPARFEGEDGDHEAAGAGRERPSIQELVREGQELVCQVTKDPLGTKGARVSTYVSLPGRYVVYMPTAPHVGVSRRITEEAERKRLKAIIESLRRPEDGGFIVRTVSTGLEASQLSEDMSFARSLWADVQERAGSVGAPALLQPDLDLVLRATRDLFTRDVGRMLVDSPHEAERVRKLVGRFAPHLVERVETYQEDEPLFSRFGIEVELERALLRKINLKSGGSIVIDEAEALTAIDVNTGSFVGSKNLEATILKTNLEAAKEIVVQLRLRNLGGIIIVDFIDLEEPENRTKVYAAFCEELRRDRAKSNVLPMSELGLVEMTRKRVRPSLSRQLTEPCPYCDGRGRIRSKKSVAKEIYREVERQARRAPRGAALVVSAMPEVAALLAEDEGERLIELEARLSRSVVVEARAELHQESFQVIPRGQGHA